MGISFILYTICVSPTFTCIVLYSTLYSTLQQIQSNFPAELYQINSGHAALCPYVLYGKKTIHHHSFEECLIFFVVSHTSLSFEMIYCSSFSLQARREWEWDRCSSNTHVSLEHYDCYLYPPAVCFFNFWCSVAI